MFPKNIRMQYKIYYKNVQFLKERVLPMRKDAVDKLTSLYVSVTQNTKQRICLPNSFLGRQAAMFDVAYKINSICSNATQKITQDSKNSDCSGFEKLSKQLKLNKLYNKKNGFIRNVSQKYNGVLYCTTGLAVANSEQLLERPHTEIPLVFEPIPEPPPVLETDILAETANQLNALGEPTFASLGFGGWTPVGIIQNCLEFLHVSVDLPWWGAIAVGTVVVRLLMFPLVVIAQRNAAKMNNYLPQLQAIQLKMTEARQCGNELEAARYSQEMMLFMKEKNLNPLKNMIVPLAQMPLFVSFFMGLRKMANLPVDSLREGGMFWFTDLTVPDQFFVLPIITSVTLWATIELGTDSAKLTAQNLQTMKYVLRALPVIIFPFTMNFPGAILCYWVASNFISLAQVGFLRIPKVRDYFKIEAHIKHNPQNLPIQSKGFVAGLKDTWTNAKITREMQERRRYDDLRFQRAGRGPLVKTYKYDPTKETNPNAIQAKKR